MRLGDRDGEAAREGERVRVRLCVGRRLVVAEAVGAFVTVAEWLALGEGEALALELADVVTDGVSSAERLGVCDCVGDCEYEARRLPLTL